MSAARVKRRRQSSRNPFIDAAMKEDAAHKGGELDDSDYSDLEDFIVCKPGREAEDYRALIDEHFKYNAAEYSTSQRTKRHQFGGLF